VSKLMSCPSQLPTRPPHPRPLSPKGERGGFSSRSTPPALVSNELGLRLPSPLGGKGESLFRFTALCLGEEHELSLLLPEGLGAGPAGLLPTAYCLLLIAYCLPQSAGDTTHGSGEAARVARSTRGPGYRPR